MPILGDREYEWVQCSLRDAPIGLCLFRINDFYEHKAPHIIIKMTKETCVFAYRVVEDPTLNVLGCATGTSPRDATERDIKDWHDLKIQYLRKVDK
jgi:hypothetical protein